MACSEFKMRLNGALREEGGIAEPLLTPSHTQSKSFTPGFFRMAVPCIMFILFASKLSKCESMPLAGYSVERKAPSHEGHGDMRR